LETAYEVAGRIPRRFRDDVWRAKRHHDVTTVITADTAEELGQQIQADYATAGQTA
jgi:hypothetical protein